MSRFSRRRRFLLGLAGLLVLVAAFLVWESRTSTLQSAYLARTAAGLTFRLEPGPSDSVWFPTAGPLDIRRGFVSLPAFTDRLEERGYRIAEQARISPGMLELCERGLYPIYREKPRAGLLLLGAGGDTLYRSLYPRWTYPTFDSIPDLVVRALLFVENRELLTPGNDMRNPAVEWDRLAKALLDQGMALLDPGRPQPGGSTLATQIEKFEHAPGGRTASPREKVRQMAAASLRSYLDGRDTREARRDIVLRYVNQVPLAGVAGYGEVNGVGDGLYAWYDTRLPEANHDLAGRGEGGMEAQALAFKKVLSLFIAQRRPSEYLLTNRARLERDTDSYLRLLASHGVISAALRDSALAVPLPLLKQPEPVRPPYASRKATNAVRNQLLALLEVPQLYVLDRLDLTAGTTLDGPAQTGVSSLLGSLSRPAVLDSLGLRGFRLLDRGDPAAVMYSFTLYEATPRENLLRVQADNLDQPLDINEGTKLDLGSAAKLRTLVTYLDVVASFHAAQAGLSPDSLRAGSRTAGDPIRRWGFEFLLTAPDTSLRSMLNGAMDRTYSASPSEPFFTGGGRHRFENMSDEDDHRVLTVREAFRRSVNLVFIRLMRDIVRFEIDGLPGYNPALLENPRDPRRAAYLERFADREGREFLARFYPGLQGKSAARLLDTLAVQGRRTPAAWSAMFRGVVPDADADSLGRFLGRVQGKEVKAGEVIRLYEASAPGQYTLADRAYVARLDPLQVWLAGYLVQHPQASWSEVVEASTGARQEAYAWLFKSRSKEKQNVRIRIVLEEEAFRQIHSQWARTGYPFRTLVPSYATSIGSSADRPAALAELMGILVNDGMRLPRRRLGTLHFAEGTPYETVFERVSPSGERVLPVEVAQVVKEALVDVVEHGTARRAAGIFPRPGGGWVPVGGKTGTGDHRFETYDRKGLLVESRVVNRAATFVFLIGDRFYGTVTAYVPGPEAAGYGFTSALPVQLLARAAPILAPLVDESARPDARP